jgi:hypothetical protein
MVSLPSKSKLKQGDNPFIDYNTSVILKMNQVTISKSPTLKSKLLFMDFQFNTLKENTITILETNNDNATPTSLSK